MSGDINQNDILKQYETQLNTNSESHPPSPYVSENRVDRIFHKVTAIFGDVGMVLILALIILTLRNALGRYFFSSPLSGNTELTCFAVVAGIFLCTVYAMYMKGHVAVSLVTDALPQKVQNVVYVIAAILTEAFLLYVGYETVRYSPEMMTQISTILKISKGPFTFIVGFAFFAMAIVFLHQVWKTLRGFLGRTFSAAILIISVALAALMIWGQPMGAFLKSGGGVKAGVITLIVFMLLMFMKMPVAAAMGLSGLIGLAGFTAWTTAGNVVAAEPFGVLYNYTWSTIPTFVFMGYLAKNSFLAEEFYFGVRQWIGHLPGGLLHAVVIGNGAFGACSGDPMGAAVTFSSISLPETRKYKYDDPITLGCIAGGGVLACLIPPSMLFIVYGAATQTSIGWLFMAGIIPGIILIVMYMILIACMSKIMPEKIPKVDKVSRKDALRATPNMLYLVIVFVVVIGGIYAGIFSPTEAGAFGATAVFLIGVIRKKLSLKKFFLTLRESAVTLGMIALILAGAMILQRLIVVTGITREITRVISNVGSSNLMFFLISGILLIILGCFIDALPLMMLMGPLLMPIGLHVGIDPVQFGVFMTIVMLIGNLTPPVGMLVYVLAGVVPEVPMVKIFKGVTPFICVMVVLLLLVALIPPLSMWMPSMMLG